MTNLPKNPRRDDYTPEEWINTFWSKSHPLGWGWKEYKYLASLPHMPLITLAKAMGKHSTKPVKDIQEMEGKQKHDN